MSMNATRFVYRPNLPKGRADCVLLGGVYRQKLEKSLERQGIRPMWCPENPAVDYRLRGHADLTAIHLGGEKLLISSEVFDASPLFVNLLTKGGIRLIRCVGRIGASYPCDTLLCAAIVGDKLFYKADIAAPEILREGAGLKAFTVNQGYAKCSVCAVSETAIITSDEGIRRKAVQAGLDVLLISSGHIELSGFDTGFIGGASFKLSEHELAFTGRLDTHPDKNSILKFLTQHTVEAVYLTEAPIFDIGSAIPLTEHVPGK